MIRALQVLSLLVSACGDGGGVPSLLFGEPTAADTRTPALSDWLRDHADAVMAVRGGGTPWQVGYGYGSQLKRLIRVNAFDGSTAVLGRWD